MTSLEILVLFMSLNLQGKQSKVKGPKAKKVKRSRVQLEQGCDCTLKLIYKLESNPHKTKKRSVTDMTNFRDAHRV